MGRILLANGSTGAGVTDGTGGQGLKPLPNMYDGWIQDTVALSGTGQLSAEVEGWIAKLTPEQKDPPGIRLKAPGRGAAPARPGGPTPCTPGLKEAAELLRSRGHDVHVVDYHDGRVFDDYESGM